jgi:tetratricopeptide (TPR) repeat protein
MPQKAGRAFDKGTQLLLKGDARGSLAYFLKAVDQAPFSYRPYHNLAVAYYKLGQLDAAEENFQKSITLTGGKCAPSMFGLAMVLYRQSDYPGAERLIREGLLLQPASATGKYGMGLVQFSMGRIIEAERSAQEALALNPDESDAYVLLGRVHAVQYNHAAELKDAQTYLKHAPNGTLKEDALALVRHAQQPLALTSTPAN